MTTADYWCGQYTSKSGLKRREPKVPDAEIVAIMQEWQTPEEIDGRVRKLAMTRTQLVDMLMERGMARTPALRRIAGLVRRGLVSQGDCPWPESYNKYPEGIHVWVQPGVDVAAKVDDFGGGDRLLRLLARLKTVIGGEANAKSLRAIQRELQDISLSALGRHVQKMVGLGWVEHSESGYFVAEKLGESGDESAPAEIG